MRCNVQVRSRRRAVCDVDNRLQRQRVQAVFEVDKMRRPTRSPRKAESKSSASPVLYLSSLSASQRGGVSGARGGRARAGPAVADQMVDQPLARCGRDEASSLSRRPRASGPAAPPAAPRA